ncbi:hypothetical protein, partial [Deferrisoma sp.]
MNRYGAWIGGMLCAVLLGAAFPARAERVVVVVNELAPQGVEAAEARVISDLLRGRLVKAPNVRVV